MAHKLAAERGKTRLYTEHDLAAEEVVGLGTGQAHYLRSVLRLIPGDQIALFNGRDGEWSARIDGIGKNWTSLKLIKQIQLQSSEVDVWLLFAPIKGGRIDYLVQKATELGVSALIPITTQRTVVNRVNLIRLSATAAEAAEQCGRLTVPEIRLALPLNKVIESWPSRRRLLFCDEAGAPPPQTVLADPGPGRWAILIGPEGGFDPLEREMLQQQSFVVPMCLGPRILRTETAAAAALSIWQALAGDNRA